MNLSPIGQIGTLLTAGLVNEETPGQYAFRHALIREAVYSNLLLKDRKHFHRAIGQAIVDLYADTLDSQLSDLSHHFYEAGLWEQALEYGRRAGERARDMYAPYEAIDHLTHAIDAARHLNSPLLSMLYRERGHAYEVLGNFERARVDYSSSLELARANHDWREEWEALVGLGFLWAARDYAQTGEYLKQSLELARASDDRHVLGHSLNRVGNWHLNTGAGTRALEFHKEALGLFTELQDQSGIAESADLLGLTNVIVGNWREGIDAFDQAVALFRALNDRRGLASALSNRALRGVFPINDFVLSDADFETALADAQEALALSREIGWRAGEAYALAILGSLFGSSGQYATGMDALECSLQMSEEIGHRQWSLFAHMALANLYQDLLELDQAQQNFEAALTTAHEIRSVNFARPLTGMLAAVLVRKRDDASMERAAQLLGSTSEGESTSGSFVQYNVDNAWIELMLARGDTAQALDFIDQRLAYLQSGAPQVLAARLSLYRAKALVALHRLAEAEPVLSGLLQHLPPASTRPFLWLVHIELGHLYRRQRRMSESTEQFSIACRIIYDLARNVPDPALRDKFRKGAFAGIPPAQRPVKRAPRPAGKANRPKRPLAGDAGQGLGNSPA